MNGDRLLWVVLSRLWRIAVGVAVGRRIAVVMVGLWIVSWCRACLGRRGSWMATMVGWRRIAVMMIVRSSTIGTIATGIDVGLRKVDVCDFITTASKQEAYQDCAAFEEVICSHGVLPYLARGLLQNCSQGAFTLLEDSSMFRVHSMRNIDDFMEFCNSPWRRD